MRRMNKKRKPIREFFGYFFLCRFGKHDYWKGSFGKHCWRCDFYEDHYEERDLQGQFHPKASQ